VIFTGRKSYSQIDIGYRPSQYINCRWSYIIFNGTLVNNCILLMTTVCFKYCWMCFVQQGWTCLILKAVVFQSIHQYAFVDKCNKLLKKNVMSLDTFHIKHILMTFFMLNSRKFSRAGGLLFSKDNIAKHTKICLCNLPRAWIYGMYRCLNF
jgi:hypothetical protein